ncbi:hypothetical protein OV203_46550 [Nannocystis sp. ILAH1]|uniref:hypothetical protein n=1 Tax=unclassified Nannocystis TaxID=2627009 RepID=UPI00226DD4F1|nr:MULTISPECIES: hypothetical protein [unclassified Nannocystis]MCY0994675.1 hypothetical protein [Nannocystis sp. ILAH1]MCY1068109.1 hypothetical protein [Nannocystis sp. RBIL2]
MDVDGAPCAFCELPHPSDNLRRDYELDFCERCADGHAEVALRERGHTIVTREWQTRDRVGSEFYTFYHFSITARPRVSLAFRASFARESTLDRQIKVFRKDLKVGDPMFDDFIYISTRDRAQVTALLDSTGAQTTLMDLVSRFNSVFFDGGAFEVRERGTEPISPDAPAMLSVAAMLVHLERTAAAPPAPAPTEDLDEP